MCKKCANLKNVQKMCKFEKCAKNVQKMCKFEKCAKVYKRFKFRIDCKMEQRGNIKFRKENKNDYIIVINYKEIKIPYFISKMFRKILEYKNENESLYKSIKRNKELINQYNNNLKLLLNLPNELKIKIKEYIIDSSYNNFILFLNELSHRGLLYKNFTNIEVFINQRDELCIIPNLYLINFINMIKSHKDTFRTFYNELIKIRFHHFRDYYIYYDT